MAHQFYTVKSWVGFTFTYTQRANRLAKTRGVAEEFFTSAQADAALELLRPSTIRG
ncbi:hypothetical protein [Stigmatella ashevillensis]|uniref:hypothetical protein n=1 Tax=Stigmatella ashevillensis TaxID=2995309 RepID=UPI00232DE089|nr:hypothetical protein [Stigmatella ashevillena]